jgi:orotidine-5'-phosphate decarboxylase
MSPPELKQNKPLNTAKTSIIIALDVDNAAQAREIVAELKDEVGAFKIGLQLFTAAGNSFVRELVNNGIKIFLDLKFYDIPNTVAKAAIEVARLGVWMFNIHACGGTQMMEQTVAAVREIVSREGLNQPKVIGVTVLTSANQQTLAEVGINNEPALQVVKLAQLASKCNLDGVVSSPQEIGLIRQSITNPDFLIVTPGIRLDGKIENDDQKRILTPKEAVNAGASYLVIGRPVLQASNRQSAVREIIAGINS